MTSTVNLNISEAGINRVTSWTSGAHKVAPKKLIAYQSSDAVLYSNSLAAALPVMKQIIPEYDGVAFRLGTDVHSNEKYAFKNTRVTDTQTGLANLGAIKTAAATSYTDNFIVLWLGAPTGMDFFNDSLWTEIKLSTEAFSRAINASGALGVFVDPEHYTSGTTYSPWSYSVPDGARVPPYVAAGKTFAQTKEKARVRGKEWILRIQALTPNIIINSTFLLSGVWTKIGKNINNLEGSIYALLPSFIDGMLDGLSAGGRIIDGREGQFYVDETRKFTEMDTTISGDDREYTFTRFEASRALLPSTRWEKYDEQVEVGGVAWTDYCFNEPTDQPNRPWGGAAYGLEWYRHHIYHTMITSDQYSWVYNWLNPWGDAQTAGGGDFRKGIKEAVALVKSGKALSYDMYKPDNIYQLNLDKEASFTPNLSGSIGLVQDTILVKFPTDKTVSSCNIKVNNRKFTINATSDVEIKFKGDGKQYTVVVRFTMSDGTHRTTNPVIITA